MTILKWLRSLFETEWRVLHIVEPDLDTYAVNYKWRISPMWNYSGGESMREFETLGQALAYIDAVIKSRREVVYTTNSLTNVEWPRTLDESTPMKITPLRRSARDAEHITELEKQLAAANAQIISGFYEEDTPQFTQGAPTHELQSVVTAYEVTGYVKQIDDLTGKVLSLSGKLREAVAALGFEKTANTTAQAAWNTERTELRDRLSRLGCTL